MHFYQANGVCHDLLSVFDGEPLSEEEAIRRALTLGLIPSATTLLRCFKHEHIERHRRKESVEYLLNHLEIRQSNGETRVHADTQVVQEAIEYQSTRHSEKGRHVHAYLETFLQQFPDEPADPDGVAQIAQPTVAWLRQYVDQVVFAERSFCDPQQGYAGTADALLRLHDQTLWLADFKLKKHSSKYPMRVDLLHWLQLSSYRRFFEKEHGKMRMGNLLLASPYGFEPQPRLIVREYQADGWNAFAAVKGLWYLHHDAPPYDTEFRGLLTKTDSTEPNR